ncbi:hypothetical protein [Salinigranum sp. GCM10025319]|uniref:hypothetical protein n=1 Tax=Salinigranum sp. GCM10025319 TaxID=3252687 RepID=UPI003621256B
MVTNAMGYIFTDDDREKDVLTSEGTHVGTIHEVKEDHATVDRDRGTELTEKVLDMLGWEDDEDDESGSHRLRGDHVARSDGDAVRLRRSR